MEVVQLTGNLTESNCHFLIMFIISSSLVKVVIGVFNCIVENGTPSKLRVLYFQVKRWFLARLMFWT